ncbi:hypothetical protein NUU61_000343 [Penicillium alfredii]|uniref:J domain-containing protein n=1 Tax=Penicillium alfredii TaxID=1506179 RepID=A0A9W9KPM7_9EURO|nr:uncharacterized protein NUU61_000343 [Penicillium alfredii]KAJ5114584.1 hypothetical protein NUU61_000343 [Penicillium alfredii]
MGQYHSTGQKSSAPAEQGEKTDYYELLGVTRNATDDEIKKAYRKKALELHPDRNYGNAEEATKLFAEIQSAYEVLADPQERAWYDSHSDAFLGTNGGAEGAQHSYNVRVTTAEDVLQMFSKFNPRMEFSDSPTGFFGGLNEQFAQLALEESLACQWEGQDAVEYPSFGTRDSDFEDVVRPFYAAWSGFSTRKSFAWKDAYRYSEAPDRRVRRLMEKENKRLREEGIREFNDAVRSLVAFVKKRDSRYKINAQNEAQRQETLRQSVAAQAARSRAANNAKMRDHVIPEWARSEERGADDEEESSESEVENFDCVACHKSFKSQKQFEAHERSKKHLKAVKQLCREMRLQDEELGLELAGDPNVPIQPATTAHLDDDSHTSSPRPDSENDSLEVEESRNTSHIDLDGEQTSKERLPAHPKSRRDSSTDSSGDEDYTSREAIEARLHSDTFSWAEAEDPITPLSDQLSSSNLNDQSTTGKLGKAKQKRARKAAQYTEQSTGLSCANCNASFTSRSKLFSHIRDNPSHAQPQPKPQGIKGKRR